MKIEGVAKTWTLSCILRMMLISQVSSSDYAKDEHTELLSTKEA